MKKLLFVAMLAAAVVAACKSNPGKEGKAPEKAPQIAPETEIEESPHVFTLGDTISYQTAKISDVRSLKKGYQVSLEFDVQYVEDERVSQEARDSINAWIGDSVFNGKDFPAGSMQELADGMADRIATSFEEEIYDGDGDDEEDFFPEFGHTGNLDIYGVFTPVIYDGYINYFVSGDEYHFGAAHGYHYVCPAVFSLETGKRLKETDLFIEGYQEYLTYLLDKYLQEGQEEEIMLFDGISPNDNYYITALGVTYVYNPYEIAAYCYGVIEVEIPWEELRPLLNPDFAALVFSDDE